MRRFLQSPLFVFKMIPLIECAKRSGKYLLTLRNKKIKDSLKTH